MAYPFSEIEQRWQEFWDKQQVFKAENQSDKPKYYVLDMFPYPSGAGLHVGHPLGYIASDIYSRFKRLEGYNVLHPMGYDAFGLPAEQYAIKTGVHPAISTEKNIQRYRQQLKAIGLSYDWSREIRTCDPSYYKHTQKTFMDLFESWYNLETQRAEPISELIQLFENKGSDGVQAHHSCQQSFSAEEFKKMNERQQREILMDYRLAYLKESFVNWCPTLATVLANDEVKEGLSVRGGHPVEQKKMPQWSLRISAYAQRLLDGLEKLDWPLALKEMQRNWIGRSEGAEVDFLVDGSDQKLKVFTTRPDTLFGVSFMVLAPESDWVDHFVTDECRSQVNDYLEQVKKKTERQRISETKKVSGVFTGGYCLHPLSQEKIPVWIGDYVLGGYGTGAIMAVPAHDDRDYAFAQHFKLPIIPVVKAEEESIGAYAAKTGELINSDFLNGLQVPQAIEKAIDYLEKKQTGKRKINYRLRDANFSRQRYWGEPIPVYYKEGTPYLIDQSLLPLELPEVDQYLPTEDGEPPLARAQNWQTPDGHPLEKSTMPGFAGSSAYYLRYMDPKNEQSLVGKQANEYWQNVDFYLGGSEHATGHLLYSRFWNFFLYDCGEVCCQEPFQKLVNQGMIQGRSQFVYRVKGTQQFVSYGLKDQYQTTPLHVDISLVNNDRLDCQAFKNWLPEFADAQFILENGEYICGHAVEKMSKSLYNVVNPDQIIEKYGADTLRLYEMFLGPLDQSKPWNTNGIEGVYRFLTKVYRQCYNEQNQLQLTDEKASEQELKALTALLKKVKEDQQSLSYNTMVSAFMIAVNELQKLKCHKKQIWQPLIIALSPLAPHLCEQVWCDLGHQTSISFAQFPDYDESLLIENSYCYPVSFNGKTRFTLDLPLDLDKTKLEKLLMQNPDVLKYLKDQRPKKIIFVPKRIINIVL